MCFLFCCLIIRPAPSSTLFPYTTLFRSYFWLLFRQLPSEIQELAEGNYKLLVSNPRHPSLHFKKVGEYWSRSEEHTSELQSRPHLVCRLLLEKKKVAFGPLRPRAIGMHP